MSFEIDKLKLYQIYSSTDLQRWAMASVPASSGEFHHAEWSHWIRSSRQFFRINQVETDGEIIILHAPGSHDQQTLMLSSVTSTIFECPGFVQLLTADNDEDEKLRHDGEKIDIEVKTTVGIADTSNSLEYDAYFREDILFLPNGRRIRVYSVAHDLGERSGVSVTISEARSGIVGYAYYLSAYDASWLPVSVDLTVQNLWDHVEALLPSPSDAGCASITLRFPDNATVPLDNIELSGDFEIFSDIGKVTWNCPEVTTTGDEKYFHGRLIDMELLPDRVVMDWSRELYRLYGLFAHEIGRENPEVIIEFRFHVQTLAMDWNPWIVRHGCIDQQEGTRIYQFGEDGEVDFDVAYISFATNPETAFSFSLFFKGESEGHSFRSFSRFQRSTPELGKYPHLQGFSLLPPGNFVRGSPENEPGRAGRESPLQSVTLSRAFYVQQTPVTWAQWNIVRDWGRDNGYFDLIEGRMGSHGDERNTDDDPVTGLGWYDVVKWLNARTEMENSLIGASLAPVYRKNGAVYRTGRPEWGCVEDIAWDLEADGYRLPSEAEWEYAVRAGTVDAFYNGTITQTGWIPLDENLDRIGWYGGNSQTGNGRQTQGVRQKMPNSFQLHDMSGNVWEWCWDFYDDYGSNPATDPIGPDRGTVRILRGGAWHGYAQCCRSASRAFDYPGSRSSGFGFRPVRTASP